MELLIESLLLMFCVFVLPWLVAITAVSPRIARCMLALWLHRAGHNDIAKKVIGPDPATPEKGT